MRRLLRAAAPPRWRRRGRASSAQGRDLVGRSGVGLRRRGAAAAVRAAQARRAGAGHLLWDAAAGARARRPRRGCRGRGVRTLAADRLRHRAAAGRHSGRAIVLDVAPRHGLLAAARVHGAGVVDRVAGGRIRVRARGRVRDPVSPRGGSHPVRPAGAVQLPDRHLWLQRKLERRLGDRGSDRPDPSAGRRRARDLRPLGRGRLERRRAARAPCDRRPADMRVRRPRADAQERGRAGHLRLPGPLQGAAGGGRRIRPLPRRAYGGSATPSANAS